MDRDALELRRGNQRIALQKQPFLLLDALIEHAGQVVTRESLCSRIWPDRIYVDFDHGLYNAAARLREALGDSSDEPRFIQTLPRIGYRFVFPAAEIHAVPPARSAPAEPGRFGPGRELRTRLAGRRTLLIAAAACIAVGVGIVQLLDRSDRSQESRSSTAGITEASRSSASVAYSVSPEAYDLYAQGRHLWNQRSPDSVGRSVTFFQRAIELDPDFAAAYAGLAQSYSLLAGTSLVKIQLEDELREPAIAAATRALQLDELLPEAHVALARALEIGTGQGSDSTMEEHYLQAIRLNPGYSDARLGYGNFLSRRARQEEAIAQFREALLHDPVSSNINSRFGMELLNAGRADEGVTLLERAAELEPWQFNTRLRLAWAYIMSCRFDDAAESIDVAAQIAPDNVNVIAARAVLAASRGDNAVSFELLQQLQDRSDTPANPFLIAIVHVALQNREEALEWLEKAARQPPGSFAKGIFRLDAPIYDWLRDDPRFVRIVVALAGPAPALSS